MSMSIISKLPHAGRLKDTAFEDHLKVCPHAGDFVVVAGDGQETEIVRESLRRKSRLPQVRHNRRGGLSTISIEINKKIKSKKIEFSDLEEASSFAGWETSVELQCCRQLG